MQRLADEVRAARVSGRVEVDPVDEQRVVSGERGCEIEQIDVEGVCKGSQVPVLDIQGFTQFWQREHGSGSRCGRERDE